MLSDVSWCSRLCFFSLLEFYLFVLSMVFDVFCVFCARICLQMS